MAFHKSSKQIDVTDGHLSATCRDCAGRDRNSKLQLDAFLGNSNGFFEWGGRDFSKSATDVTLRNEGESLFLHARLRTQHRSWRDARVNLSERIENCDGVLQYIGGKEPHIEYSRDFLGEQTDFISAVISDTISDLRELFSGSSLFDDRTDSHRNRDNFVAREYPESFESNGGAESESHGTTSSSRNMEESTSSVRTSVLRGKGEPPAYDCESASENTKTWLGEKTAEVSSPADALQTKEQSTQQSMEYYSEEASMALVREFLFSGNGRTIRSFKAKDGERAIELCGEDGKLRTIHIQENTLFDQDEFRRGSISEASDRCMTPSIVDGEEEYDFLD